MHYVGLSRVRNSSALHILNLNENKIKVTEKVKSEMSRLRTEVSLVPLALLQTDNSQQQKLSCFRMLDLSTSTWMMCKVITTFKKLISTFLLNQNFVFRIEIIHINLVNLPFTEMTLVSLT